MKLLAPPEFIPIYTREEVAIAVAKYLGTRIQQSLGDGSCGQAFLLWNGQVLKLTKDATEYHMSKTLVGRPIPHINEVYRCIKVDHTPTMEEYYCIIQKYVQQDTPLHRFAERLEMDDSSSYTKLIRNYMADQLSWNDMCEELDSIMYNLNPERFGGNKGMLQHLFEQWKEIAKYVVHETAYTGNDFFVKNSGWDADRNQLVMFDLGYSWDMDLPEQDDVAINV